MNQARVAQAPEYVLYLRKSNGRKAVPRQRSITSKYIDGRGGVVLMTFSDTDKTAWKGGTRQSDRGDFQRLLNVLRDHRGLHVAAWHADRLLRDEEDLLILGRICRAGGHVIETPTGGIYDMATASGRKRLRDDASDAIFEVDHLQERVLAGRDEVAAEGRWLGGKRPFGWELDEHPRDEDGKPMLDEDGKPVNGILRLVDAESAAIKKGSGDVVDGISVNSIKREWRAAGLTGTGGAFMSEVEVRRILMRPRNAGLMEHRGQITGKASWPAIVDEPIWRAVCAVLNDPKRRTTPGPARQHLLSGIARCGTCGAPMICSTVGPSRGKRSVYRCRANRAAGGSGHVARDAATLDGYVSALLIERLSRSDAARLLVHEHESDLPGLYQRKAVLESAMRASNDLRRQGLLTPAEFAVERREHQEQAAQLDEKIAAAEQVDVLTPMLRAPAEVWETRTLDQKRAIISTLMEITVHPQPKGRPKGWQPGQPYFDPEIIKQGIKWKRG